MTTEMGSRFRCAEQVHARRFDEEIVLVDLAGGVYFSLDEVGGAIWDGLVEGLSLAKVVERLAVAYDGDPEAIRHDAERIIGELVAAGLLVAVADP